MEVAILTMHDDANMMTRLINKYLREGWSLRGNLVSHVCGERNMRTKYIQTMVKGTN